MKQFPVLYHLGKNKSLYSWQIHVDGANIHSSTGQVDGQRVNSVKVATPKNTGRANATTAEEQALKEAEAMHKHKLTRKYSLTPGEAKEEEIAPMLAQSFEKRKDKNVTYPLDFQPKLDGVRGLASWDGDSVVLTSRGYKEWTVVTHILDELKSAMGPGDILDGELYIHGVGFQTLASWVKRSQPDTFKLEYHVYDMPSHQGEDSLTWTERRKNLEDFFKRNPNLKFIKHVPTKTLNSEAEVVTEQATVVADGFEGGIVRLFDGEYTYGYRSYDLLKVKSFDDAEFKVTGVKNGKGKFSNCAIWICETNEGKDFDATPKVSQAEKEAFLRNADKYIGKMLTVKYFGWTDSGRPRFPIALHFRPEEDLPI